jgi:hypothetical protein
MEKHLMLAQGDGWAPVFSVAGGLVVLLDQGDAVTLRMGPEGLALLRSFFRGAPHDLSRYSMDPDDDWLPLDVTQGKKQ